MGKTSYYAGICNWRGRENHGFKWCNDNNGQNIWIYDDIHPLGEPEEVQSKEQLEETTGSLNNSSWKQFYYKP